MYKVKQGEQITDVVLNNTGSLDNWGAILDANLFTSWTPVLIVGQQIIIPDLVVEQPNNKRILQIYPAVNNCSAPDLDLQIATLIATFTSTIPNGRADNNLTAKMDSTLYTLDQNI